MNPLSHRPGVVIYAKDIARVGAFYAAVLDSPATAVDDYVLVESPTLQLFVLSIPAPIAATFVIADPPELREETPIKVAFPVQSIDAVRQVVGELGGAINPTSAQWRFGEYLVCDGYDPEGNVVQLRQPHS